MNKLTAIISFISVIAVTSVASACNIPVFRYALERWSPDPVSVIVFYDGTLSNTQQVFVKQLQESSSANKGPTNITVALQHTSQPMDDSVALLWDQFSGRPDVSLPYVVVRSSVGGRMANNWHGTLDNAANANLLQSPVREALCKRLLAGDSAVWLVLRSTDQQRSNAIAGLLNEQLSLLAKKIPLPEGIGLPGSELFSDIPLLMKFTVLEIDVADRNEAFLVELLKGFEPEALREGEPLVIPVFGRGRALEVIPATQVDARLIEDLTLFLCGACSCQVKERNPGFDLPLTAPWETELFGEDAEEITSQIIPPNTLMTEPMTVAIPPGRSPVATTVVNAESVGLNMSAQDSGNRTSSAMSLSWTVVTVVAVVLILLAGHALRN